MRRNPAHISEFPDSQDADYAYVRRLITEATRGDILARSPLPANYLGAVDAGWLDVREETRTAWGEPAILLTATTLARRWLSRERRRDTMRAKRAQTSIFGEP